MGLLLNLVVHYAIHFNSLEFQATTLLKVIHCPGGAALIHVCSRLLQILDCTIGIRVSVEIEYSLEYLH
jgi:hypothetical protein